MQITVTTLYLPEWPLIAGYEDEARLLQITRGMAPRETRMWGFDIPIATLIGYFFQFHFESLFSGD